MSRFASCGFLIAGLLVGAVGCAPEQGRFVSAPAPGSQDKQPNATPLSPLPTHSSEVLPWAPDSLSKATQGRSKAFEAARIDPGILMYVEPPQGTEMPALEPPKHVDPEMIWPPDPSLGSPRDVEPKENWPADP